MGAHENEEPQLRSVALKNASSILQARRRAEAELVAAKEALDRRSAELAQALALMRATLEASTDGILVTDGEGRVTHFNENYVRTWQIPAEVMTAREHQRLLEYAAGFFADPGSFLARVDGIYAGGPIDSFDELTLRDGRVLERYSKIQFIEQRHVGRVWIFRDITARRRDEEALQQQREWFKVTLSSIGDAVVTTDTQAKVTFLNPIAEAMTGWPFADALSQPLEKIFNIIHEQTREVTVSPVKSALRDGLVVKLANHTTLIRRDGTETAIEDSAAPIRDPQGNITGAVMVFHDVSAKRKAEDALRLSHAQFSAMIDQSPVGIYLVDSSLRIQHVNAKGRPAFGPITSIIGRDLSEVLSLLWAPHLVTETVRLFQHTLATGAPHIALGFAEERRDSKAQHYYDWELHRVALPDGQHGVVCYFLDTSVQVLAQRALRENEQQLWAIFNQATVGMATASLDGKFEKVNERLAAILGYEPAELQERSFIDITHEADRAATQRELRALLTGKVSRYSLEKRYVRKDGSLVWSLITVTLMKNSTGSPERFIGVIEDISDRKRAEAARQQSAERLQLALDAGRLGDWTWDAPTDALSFGPRFAEIYALSPTATITWTELAERIHPDDRAAVELARQQALRTRTDYSVDYRIVRPSGAERWIATHGRGIYSERGLNLGMSGVVQDITELKNAHAGIEERERQLSLVYHHVSDVIFNLSVEPDGGFRFQTVNEPFLAATGLAKTAVIGRRIEEVIPEPSRSLALAYYRRALAEKKTVRWEQTTHAASGENVGIVSVTPVFDSKGHILNLIGTVHDVSERRRSEEARLRLAAVVESSDDAIYSTTLEGIINSWNRGAERMFGYRAPDMIGQSLALLFPPERIEEESSILKRLLAGERIDHYETTRRRRDGTRIDVAVTVSPIHDTASRIVGISKIARDVTARRSSEEALRASEQRFRDLADAMPQIVWTANQEGYLDYYNRRWYDYTGMPQDGKGDASWTPVVHPDDLERTRQEWLASVSTGKPFEIEARYKNREGQYRWHLGRALAQKNEQGQIVRWYGSSTDIHEQKQTAEALREEYIVTAHLNQVAQALASELEQEKIIQLITDAGTRIIRAQFGAFFHNVVDERGASYMLYTLSGISRDAFAKFPMPRATGLFGPTFRGEGIVRIDDVAKDPRFGQNPPYHGMPAGHPPVSSFLAVPVFARSGKVIGGLFFGHARPGAFNDRDEKVIIGIAAQAAAALDTARIYQAEQQARNLAEQANRAKDHFLATLSHELRTPLTPVLALLTGVGEDSAIPPELATDLATVRRNVELEARLIDDLLDLTRITRGKLELHRERVPVGQMIENAINTCQTELTAKQLTLIQELVQPELMLSADNARITQILWNLLRNSIKFTPTGGSIWVRLKPPAPGEEPREVTIEVQDTGIGMEPAQMARMFDAFEQGGRKVTQQFGGLGLGLAISKAIAEAHQGTITGTSDGIDRGSLFTVTLPIQSEPNEKPGLTPPQPSVAPTAENGAAGVERRARILLVEDHADTAAVLVRMLRRTGYEVMHAPSIEAALKTADTEMSGAGLDLVISDLSLPDGSGLDLMKSLSANYRLRGIALSGFGMDSDREQSAAAGFTRHLTKPIDIAILRRTIAELLPPPKSL
jgi:PAS domain S-box-containing protein